MTERPDPIAVALIEDNRLMREGITALLNQTEHCRVVAAAPMGDTTLLRSAKPQVVLLDLGLSNGDSLRVAENVRREFPEAKVVVMDLLPVHEDLVEFVNAGVSGFIMKDATLDDLVNTIRSVAEGGHILPPQMTSTLFSQIARDAIARGREEDAIEAVRLTPRERQIVELIGDGLSNKRIALDLEIAPETVKSHVRNIMEKLALHSRLQIAAYAHRNSQD